MNQSIEELLKNYSCTQFLLTQRIAKHLSFAIITACNPRGEVLAQSQNRHLDKLLLNEIEQLHCPYRAIIGAANDMSHFEKSWAVFTDKSQAVILGERYVQNAIFYVEQGELSLIPILLKANEVSLGSFQKRINLISDFPPDVSNGEKE
ncbi:DUF3293 domain-containing protein [Parashewanella curva]|uniref:DUF3293 domain-containing protein n=1 Tax=Parashewanella curva TaxID=2338552 RepID=A0A3L8PV58_9GAMM|nr:DUF3293 domain-containing protein [Parashewanella curva]RLV59230.1 DUF3293 domain-containing protein [Parashewanella curva]